MRHCSANQVSSAGTGAKKRMTDQNRVGRDVGAAKPVLEEENKTRERGRDGREGARWDGWMRFDGTGRDGMGLNGIGRDGIDGRPCAWDVGCGRRQTRKETRRTPSRVSLTGHDGPSTKRGGGGTCLLLLS